MEAIESADRTLLRQHIEAVWSVRLPSLTSEDVDVLPDSNQPDWFLCAANLASGRVRLWRPDVSAREREALRSQIDEVLASPPVVAQPIDMHREVALALTASPRLDEVTARSIARSLTPADQALVETFEPGSSDYFFHPTRQPLIGVIVSGQLLSVAHSSRRTPEACELGIETALQARHKGYALAATLVWTQGILQEGLVPLYSADATNTASLHLADAAGYRAFAHIAQWK